MKELFKNLIKDEKGNGLVEFVLIFPIILLLTAGNLYLTISFSQKSIMNGIAFMQLRSAAVRDNQKTIAKSYTESYAKKSGQKWAKNIKIKNMSAGNVKSGNPIKITIEKESESMAQLNNLISLASGKKPSKDRDINKISTSMVLNSELVKARTGSYRPNTTTTVDYRTYNDIEKYLNKVIFNYIPNQKIKNAIKGTIIPKKLVDSVDKSSTKSKDSSLTANSKQNMKNVNEFYKDWIYNPKIENLNKEYPEGGTKLKQLETTGENIKKIETGADFLGIILDALKPILGPLAPLIDAIELASGLLYQFAGIADGSAKVISDNNNLIFQPLEP